MGTDFETQNALLDEVVLVGLTKASPGPNPGLQIMDELSHGVLVVTLAGHVLHQNQIAKSALDRQGELFVSEGKVRCASVESMQRLQAAFAKVMEGGREFITLQGERDKLSMVAIPLRSEPGMPARVALFLERVDESNALMRGMFARAHGLTATEETVLDFLCQGCSAPEAARRMSVAVSTVRSHVKSICAKTRSNGVRELTHRVSLLPPLLAPDARGPVH